MANGGHLVVKNTFIDVVDEPSSPLAQVPPCKTAPGKMQAPLPSTSTVGAPKYILPGAAQQEASPQQQQQHRPTFLRRIFGSSRTQAARVTTAYTVAPATVTTATAGAAGSAPPVTTMVAQGTTVQPTVRFVVPAPSSPVSVQQKNTFVHFEEPKSPCAPPTKTAPGNAVFLGSHAAPGSPIRHVLTGGRSPYGGSPYSGSVGSPVAQVAQVAQIAQPQFWMAQPQPMPTTTVIQTVAPQQLYVVAPTPAVSGEARGGSTSLGSEGHAEGQCIPCLMQVRWQAGKCTDPCRFGELCGRCHEAHTEDELQRIQAKMRKLKKRGGAAGAAVLSAAYVHGNVAPVGGGAGQSSVPRYPAA